MQCTLLYMRNGPVRINQTYSTFPMSLPSVVRPKRVRLFRLQLFRLVAKHIACCRKCILKTHRATRCGEHKRAHTHTTTKKIPNTIDIIDKRVVVVVVEIIVIEEGENYYCSKHENRYTYI